MSKATQRRVVPEPCAECGQLMHFGSGKYCSPECRNPDLNTGTAICICGKEYKLVSKVKPRTACGKVCAAKLRRKPMEALSTSRKRVVRRKEDVFGVQRVLTYQGQTKGLYEWAKELEMAPNTIGGRLDRGWSVERALSERPIKKYAY